MICRRFVQSFVSFVLLTSLTVPLLAGTPAESAFKKLQSLAGEWEGKDAHGMAAKTSFAVLASGTAVMEKLAAPGMEEMVTLYSMDRDGIALVHYCPTNNQPRMRVVPSSDEVKELSFDYQGAGNLKAPETGHQHAIAIRGLADVNAQFPRQKQRFMPDFTFVGAIVVMRGAFLHK
ncbi:MAG TPA: hypothetical protein VF740_07125, partial [Candidatus Acidoferrum sp.]